MPLPVRKNDDAPHTKRQRLQPTHIRNGTSIVEGCRSNHKYTKHPAATGPRGRAFALKTEMEEPNAGKAGIPIVVGILVGLLASFVQSLGESLEYP